MAEIRRDQKWRKQVGPKANGPWTIIKKMPTGVTFQIENEESGMKKIVHHDKLNPVRGDASIHDGPRHDPDATSTDDGDDSTSSASSSEHSDYSPSSDDSEAEPDEDRCYPVRQRTARVIPGAILVMTQD